MNSWANPPQIPILSDEELESKFVHLSAKWPNYSCFDIARYCYEGQVDGEERAMQAATKWQFDLRVQERIRLLRVGGEPKSPIPTEEQQIAALWIIASDETAKANDRIAAQKLIAEMTGRIKKPPEDKGSDKPETGGDFLFELAAKLPD